MRKLLGTAACLVTLPGFAFGQLAMPQISGNQINLQIGQTTAGSGGVTVTQSGSGHDADANIGLSQSLRIEQVGTGHSVSLTATSRQSAATLGVRQAGSGGRITLNAGSVSQTTLTQGEVGVDNSITIRSAGAVSDVHVDQEHAVRASADLTGSSVSGRFTQSGGRLARHQLSVSSAGAITGAEIDQAGDGHTVALTGDAAIRGATLSQSGHGNSIDATALLVHEVGISQSGSGNTSHLAVSGKLSDSSISQSGDDNNVSIHATGVTSGLALVQQGVRNTSTLRASDIVAMTASQLGSNNVIDLATTASLSGEIRQDGSRNSVRAAPASAGQSLFVSTIDRYEYADIWDWNDRSYHTAFRDIDSVPAAISDRVVQASGMALSPAQVTYSVQQYGEGNSADSRFVNLYPEDARASTHIVDLYQSGSGNNSVFTSNGRSNGAFTVDVVGNENTTSNAVSYARASTTTSITGNANMVSTYVEAPSSLPGSSSPNVGLPQVPEGVQLVTINGSENIVSLHSEGRAGGVNFSSAVEVHGRNNAVSVHQIGNSAATNYANVTLHGNDGGLLVRLNDVTDPVAGTLSYQHYSSRPGDTPGRQDAGHKGYRDTAVVDIYLR